MTIAAASQLRSSLSQSELADMLSISGASMVHMIDRLVTAGLDDLDSPTGGIGQITRTFSGEVLDRACDIRGRSCQCIAENHSVLHAIAGTFIVF
jgi:hypothetical protein